MLTAPTPIVMIVMLAALASEAMAERLSHDCFLSLPATPMSRLLPRVVALESLVKISDGEPSVSKMITFLGVPNSTGRSGRPASVVGSTLNR